MYSEALTKKLCRTLREIDEEQQEAKADAKAHKERIDELLDEAREIRIKLESKQEDLFPQPAPEPEPPKMEALAAEPPASDEPAASEEPPILEENEFPPVAEMNEEQLVAAAKKIGLDVASIAAEQLRDVLSELWPASTTVAEGPSIEEMSPEEVVAMGEKIGLDCDYLTVDEIRAKLLELADAVLGDGGGEAAPEPVDDGPEASGVPGMNAYDQGAQARMDGRPATDNPYPPNTYDGNSWANGWSEFEQLAEQASGS